MTRDAVLETLRTHEAALRKLGVLHAALFGSTVRNEAGAASDIDIMVDIDPAADVDLYDYIGITQFIADLFTSPVDVAERSRLVDRVRETAERDAVYAF